MDKFAQAVLRLGETKTASVPDVAMIDAIARNAAKVYASDGTPMNVSLGRDLRRLGPLPDHLVHRAVTEANNLAFQEIHDSGHNGNIDYEVATVDGLELDTQEAVQPEPRQVDQAEFDYERPPEQLSTGGDVTEVFPASEGKAAAYRLDEPLAERINERFKCASTKETIESRMITAHNSFSDSMGRYMNEVLKLAHIGVSRDELQHVLSQVAPASAVESALEIAHNCLEMRGIEMAKSASVNPSIRTADLSHPVVQAFERMRERAKEVEKLSAQRTEVIAKLHEIDTELRSANG